MRILLAALLLVVLPMHSVSAQSNAPALETLLRDKVTIQTQDNKVYDFNVELALTPRQQAKGLMLRTFMDNEAGMLFLFNEEAPRRFWMKNTLIPLDIIFIRENGIIHHIHENAQPHDLSGAPSNGPVSAVLEINGGLSEKLGIKKGDRLIHPVFNSAIDE